MAVLNPKGWNQRHWWVGQILGDFPEDTSPRDKYEALAHAICQQWLRMKGLRQIDNEWDRREDIISELEEEEPDLFEMVINSYEHRRDEIAGETKDRVYPGS